MISPLIVTLISVGYFALLFAVAYYADARREAGRSIINNPYIYSLSLGVYCTSWTYYGSVGRAATSGLDFLPIYLGPTLIAFTWWFLLRKMVRISKEQNIVSIADFISSRYDRSPLLGAVVTLIAVLGIMPYIALQLKAVARTFDLLVSPTTITEGGLHELFPALPNYIDTGFVMAFILGLFGVLFGARHLDASERHEGLVAAVAFESIVKLFAFCAVGIFVTFGMFDGFGDIFTRFAQQFPERLSLFRLDTAAIPYTKWFTLLFASMMAIMFLPRQFHIMVTENADENHIKGAMWRFPAYIFLLNLFVIPIALGGLLLNGGDTSQADYFVINLPLAAGQPWLALLVFIGGFSASAGMVMVSSVTLSTMILNHLIMPIILRLKANITDYSVILINLKRIGIFAVVFLGYLYYRVIGDSYALTNMGLISFIAAAQFAPAVIGGLYWRRANQKAALTGLSLGFLVWFYTLLIPSFVLSGWMKSSILDQGPFGISLLRPLHLFGLTGFDLWTNALFWTMFFNLGAYLCLSFFCKQKQTEVEQAQNFIDFYGEKLVPEQRRRISKAPTIMEFVELMSKFIGEKPANAAISSFLSDHEVNSRGSLSDHEIPALKAFTERTLAGYVGSAPAKIILANYLSTRGSEMEDVFDIFGSVTLSRTASRDQLSVLYEAAKIVSRSSDLAKTLDGLLKLLMQQFRFDLCVIRFLDKQSMTLSVKAQMGMTSEHFGQSERNLDMKTYIGATFLSNTASVVNDTEFLDKHDSAVIIHREKIKSFAHAPIVVEGEPAGVLSAFSRTSKGIFTDEFVALFNNLARQVGIAWRNHQQLVELLSAREQERDLQIAKTIQMSLLPLGMPDLKNIDLAGLCVPAHEVGGDYYDFIRRPNGTLDLVIADVSGHSIGSALIMAETRTFIQAMRQIEEPYAMLDELNRFFCEDLSRAELFVTMFYTQYHPTTGELLYANAGHNNPILWRSNTHTCETLDGDGMILGIKPDIDFEQRKTHLTTGDILVLYTDGITEAEDSSGQFFGDMRLYALINEYQHLPAAELIDQILEQIRLFTGNRHFNDDVSLVVMKIIQQDQINE
ncbi:sodium:solute symporter family transporter [Geopsychrobacter electrodiphilus]|uniref:sodium:solute symporter family transporter n=1 Tax=Geopsychrobacter electrodiphilus TaxID=225196 RepID=UPI00037EAC81|nr:SpoIIE family protein phosphatase [Geopsychrobacter electrodiphilus]